MSTKIDEIADGLYRIHTPVGGMPGGFSFNQYLLVDDDALLFHTGPRALAPDVQQAVAAVLPLERLKYISFSHVESDECGGLNALLAVAPNAVPLCSRLAAMVSMDDLADRAPRALADDERLSLGRRTLRWLDAPHVPHGWENGFIAVEELELLFCGDLFTQPGDKHAPLVRGDILGPSEAMRASLDYYAHAPNTAAVLRRLAALQPRLLACMHGSAWEGDGRALLRALENTVVPGTA